MPAPGLRGSLLFLILCLLGSGGCSQGRKAHESAGKIQSVLGCKTACYGFLEGRNLISPKLSESICSQKEGAGERRRQEKGVSGRKELATVHIRQHPTPCDSRNVGSKEAAWGRGLERLYAVSTGWYFILWVQS